MEDVRGKMEDVVLKIPTNTDWLEDVRGKMEDVVLKIPTNAYRWGGLK